MEPFMLERIRPNYLRVLTEDDRGEASRVLKRLLSERAGVFRSIPLFLVRQELLSLILRTTNKFG